MLRQHLQFYSTIDYGTREENRFGRIRRRYIAFQMAAIIINWIPVTDDQRMVLLSFPDHHVFQGIMKAWVVSI